MGLFDKLLGKKSPEEQPKGNQGNVTLTFTSQVGSSSPSQDIPPYQGDYAKAVFLNVYAKASPVKKATDYQSYLLYECGIRDAAAFHKGLIYEGLLQESTAADRLAGLKVTELKQLLSEIGLPNMGKKDALVQKAVENCTDAMLHKYCPETMYSISEAGTLFLNAHDDYIRIHTHRNWGIDWQEYDRRKNAGRSFNDNMWQIFNERIMHSSNFGRNEYLNMYQLLVEEKKRPDALVMLLRIIYIDLSGTEGANYINLYKAGSWTLKELEDCFDAAIMLAPGLINDVPKYREVYDDALITKVYTQKLPVLICSQQLFTDIIHSILDGTYDENAVSAKLKRAYNKYVRELKK